MSKRNTYKTCFVPLCKSTTIKTPHKLFFYVPQAENLRKKWFKSAHRPDEPGKWSYFCCQDHFNLKEDMDNYIRYCMMGAPIKLKKDVIPHIFNCQPHQAKTLNNLFQPIYNKLNRKREIAKILLESKNQNENSLPQHKIRKTENNQVMNSDKIIFVDMTNDNTVTSHVLQPTKITATTTIEIHSQEALLTPELINSINFNDTLSTSQVQSTCIPSNNEIEINSENTLVDVESTSQTLSHTHSSAKIEDKQKLLDFGKSPVSKNKIDNISQRSFGVQVIQKLVKPHFRSKSIICKPSTTDASCQSQIEVANKMYSPIKSLLKTPAAAHSNLSSSAVVSCLTNSLSDYQYLSSYSEYKSSSCSEERKENNTKIKESALNITRYFISMNAKKYIGIGNEWLWIIDLLHTSTKCNIDNIKLTLMKIRTNDTFSRLGDQFGLSTLQASRVFNKTVKPLAHYLKTLVYCPNQSSIKINLPVAFRAYYSHICAILDAFKIEIEKPSDPVQQALTWSEYKKCNTLKYLIACTPNGFIIFISSGYGDRISDIFLFEESKIMNILPEKCGVMADRGFKQIQTVLNQKECELVRPPSVSTSKKSMKEEVLKTKSIASLRIHIERVIRRVREYKILEPHSCLNLNTMSYVDSIVTIVAGLINLQNPIIKK